MPSIEDFNHLDIRIGTIINAREFPEARKPAYKLEIDFGEIGVKTSSAQITVNYQPSDLIGKQIVAVVNLPPRNIAGYHSECLVLGVETSNKGVVLLQPEQKVENGLPIS